MLTKRYYRMNSIDFHKWCKRVKPSLELARFYTHMNADVREKLYSNYKDSLLIKKQFNLLRLSLDENKLKTLDSIINHEIKLDLKKDKNYIGVFNNWCMILFPNNTSEIETLDRKDIASEITKLRIERGYNREEVSGIIKIHPVSLKEYEDGKRLIPIDKLYSILQIYNVEISDFIKNVKKRKIYY